MSVVRVPLSRNVTDRQTDRLWPDLRLECRGKECTDKFDKEENTVPEKQTALTER